ncbi:MAG: aldo/keto reductase [Mycetocola sp.]
MTIDSYSTLGTAGLRVSPLELGAMNFDDGGRGSAPRPRLRSSTTTSTPTELIDTANHCNAVRSEETLGDYFEQHLGRRHRVALATKFGGTLHPSDSNAGGTGRKAIYTELDESLRRLNTD